ncbi:MAG: hypothetical protein GXP47_04525 [Acidobacteria bacterium]|nr:hypothetical protein [Acidobacteriota bacterium]
MKFLKIVAMLVFAAGLAPPAWSQTAQELEELVLTTKDGKTITGMDKAIGQIYGFVQTDAGHNSGRINSDWFDVIRPSMLPSHENQYGEDGENYMNDATSDIGTAASPGNAVKPLAGELIPVWGVVAFYDFNWNERWTSSLGFSIISLDNGSFDATPDTFDEGRYALANVLYHPTPALMIGGELQYGYRENYSDGWDYDELRVQFSARYRFSFGLGAD